MSEKLEIEIVLTKADTKKAFTEVEKKAEKAGKKSGEGFGRSFSTSVKGAASTAIKGFIGVTVAAVGLRKAMDLLGASFDNLRGFSRGVSEINSILPKNQKLTEQSTRSLIKFSAVFGSDQQSQARAFYNIVSAGVKGTSKQLKTLAIANTAAVAGLVDIDSSAKVLVSSVNAYARSGLTAKEASDALFVAVREGQTTFGELASFLGNVTSVASAAGLGFSELAGFLAFTTKNGLATDVAVTGLRQVLTSLIKPSKEAADEAKRLGIDFSTAGLRSKKLGGFLQDLIKKTGGSEVALGKLFGNVRALTPILQVAGGNFKELDRILGETKNSSGATATAFSEISKNLDFKLDRVSSEFSALGLNLLRVVNPALTTFADGLKFIGKGFNSFFENKKPSLVDNLSASLKTVNKDIKAVKASLATAKGFPQKTLFGGISASGKRVQALSRDLVELKERRIDLRKDIVEVRELEKGSNDARVENEKTADKTILAERVTLFSELAALGVKSIGTLVAAEDAKIAKLNELNEKRLITESDYAMALVQIRAQTDEKLNELEREKVAKSIEASGSISDAFLDAAKNTKSSTVALGKALNNLAINGYGRAMKSIGNALAKGENVNQAFVDSAKATAGEAASAFGDYYIKVGVAEVADTKGASGWATIAGGSALKVLAGALGSSGGGGGANASTGGGGAGGGGGQNDLFDNGVLDQADLEREEPKTNVEIVVQGSLVQQEELGQFITETLNESFGKQGVTLTDARFA